MTNRARIYTQLGDEELAEAYRKRVRLHESLNPYYHYALAEGAYRDGDYANALSEIKSAISRKRDDHRFYFLEGLIHYVQAFCHRGIGDIIFRESLGLPVLTLEGNQDYYLTQHVKTRIEAYLDMIRRKQAAKR